MERKVRYGTYSATTQAAGWLHILTALGAMRDEYTRLGLHGLAEDVERTRVQIEEQVTEWRQA